MQEERERLAATRGAPTMDRDEAATKIQKVICLHLLRSFVKRLVFNTFHATGLLL